MLGGVAGYDGVTFLGAESGNASRDPYEFCIPEA